MSVVKSHRILALVLGAVCILAWAPFVPQLWVWWNSDLVQLRDVRCVETREDAVAIGLRAMESAGFEPVRFSVLGCWSSTTTSGARVWHVRFEDPSTSVAFGLHVSFEARVEIFRLK